MFGRIIIFKQSYTQLYFKKDLKPLKYEDSKFKLIMPWIWFFYGLSNDLTKERKKFTAARIKNIRKPYKFRAVVSECLSFLGNPAFWSKWKYNENISYFYPFKSTEIQNRVSNKERDFIDDCTEFIEFFYDSFESAIYYNTVYVIHNIVVYVYTQIILYIKFDSLY